MVVIVIMGDYDHDHDIMMIVIMGDLDWIGLETSLGIVTSWRFFFSFGEIQPKREKICEIVGMMSW